MEVDNTTCQWLSVTYCHNVDFIKDATEPAHGYIAKMNIFNWHQTYCSVVQFQMNVCWLLNPAFALPWCISVQAFLSLISFDLITCDLCKTLWPILSIQGYASLLSFDYCWIKQDTLGWTHISLNSRKQLIYFHFCPHQHLINHHHH